MEELSGRGFFFLTKSAMEKLHVTMAMFTCTPTVWDQSKELHGLRCLHDMSNSPQAKLIITIIQSEMFRVREM